MALLCGDVVLAVTACIVYRYMAVFADTRYVEFFSQKQGAFVIIFIFLATDCGAAYLCWLCYIPQDVSAKTTQSLEL